MTQVITVREKKARQPVKEQQGSWSSKGFSSIPCAQAPQGHVEIDQQQDTEDGFHNHTFYL
jgi:hypothetical protein